MSDGVMLQQWIRDMRLNRTVICHSDENCALDEEDVFQKLNLDPIPKMWGRWGKDYPVNQITNMFLLFFILY